MNALNSSIDYSHDARPESAAFVPADTPVQQSPALRQPEIPKSPTRLSPQKVTWDNYLFIPSPQTLNITVDSNGSGSCSVNGTTIQAEPGRPAGRTDGDATTWSYYDAGGLVQKKTYADGTHEDSEYNALNMIVKKTDARGITTTYTWDVNQGVCTNIAFSDGTLTQQFTYNHIGNLYRIVDASGTRDITYNIYNEQETDGITVNGSKHTVTEAFDSFGRSAGYVLGKGTTSLDTVTYGYSAEGRFATASFLHGGEEKTFTYSYLEGTNLLHTIAHPNNILITRSYEEHRDLAISMNATRGATNVVLRGYSYDELGRPVTRSCARQGTSRQDSFAYNDRSELTSASLGTTPYAYAYDNIGNRETAQEAAQAVTTYATNPLNQYSEITQGEATPFTPEYDAAGNQTKVKTSTGIWAVVYDANNRPTSFTSEDGQTVIACGYATPPLSLPGVFANCRAGSHTQQSACALVNALGSD